MKFFIAETFEYKKRQLNPYISNKEKIVYVILLYHIY